MEGQFEDKVFEFGRISRSGQKTDEVVVESLKSLYDCFSLSDGLTESSSSLIDGFYQNEELTNVVFTESNESQVEGSQPNNSSTAT